MNRIVQRNRELAAQEKHYARMQKNGYGNVLRSTIQDHAQEAAERRAQEMSAKKHNMQRVTKVIQCEDCDCIQNKQHYLEPIQ